MPPSTMLTISFLLIINALSLGGINAVDNNNMYMQLIHMTAKHANKTGCYVCGIFVQLICGKVKEGTAQVVHYKRTPTAYII